MSSKKWLFGALIIGVAIVALSFLQLGDSLVYFYTPAEAQEQASQLSRSDIRLGGMVNPGSIVKNPETLEMNFVLTDLKGHEINVHYRGSPPDMFKENQGVVAEGKIAADGHSFNAKKLLVKHSEEYKKPDSHMNMDKEYLQKSLFKGEGN